MVAPNPKPTPAGERTLSFSRHVQNLTEECLYPLAVAPKQMPTKSSDRRVGWGQLMQAGLSWHLFNLCIQLPSEEAQADFLGVFSGSLAEGVAHLMMMVGCKSLNGHMQA